MADKNYHAQYSRDRYEQVGEIGTIPPAADPDRRVACEKDFALWRATYCKPRHDFDDSKNHAIMCDRIQEAIESRDGWFGILAPRGEAKTTTIVEGIGWAIASGRKKFPVCFSSSAATNRVLVKSFSALFTKMPILAEDYPEICVPIHAKTEKNKQRQVLLQGKKISILWEHYDSGLYYFQFPDIPGNSSCGVLTMMQSINSKIRGQQYSTPDGRVRRPDLAFFDDIQDPKIAKNPDRVQGIWENMTEDAAGLSGSDPMPIINSGTPFHTECFMARTIDDRRFSGLTLRSIYSFPKNMDLWDKYRQIWEETYDNKVQQLGLFNKDKANTIAFETASRFYLDNQEIMDEGMDMSWPAKYGSHKYTGATPIENIMREYLIILEPEVFSQEKNCELKPPVNNDVEFITKELFHEKIDMSLDEFTAPKESTKLTFGIDVHKNILYYEGVAWADGFDGHVITYGTFPEQNGTNWTQKTARHTLKRKYPKAGIQGAILKGLNDLVEKIVSQRYFREDGSEIFVDKILIDNNNGDFQPTVEKFVEESPCKEKLVTYIGRWYAAGTQSRNKKDKGGPEWRWDRYAKGKTAIVAFRDYWKSYNLDRWLTTRGDAGCKTMFKGGEMKFRQFYKELTAQKPRIITLPGNQTIRRWPTSEEMKGQDDHWGDCDFMCTLAASVCGLSQDAERKTKRKTEYLEVPDHLKAKKRTTRRIRR